MGNALMSMKKLGSELAKETDLDADLVVPVPDSGVPRHWAMQINQVKNSN